MQSTFVEVAGALWGAGRPFGNEGERLGAARPRPTRRRPPSIQRASRQRVAFGTFAGEQLPVVLPAVADRTVEFPATLNEDFNVLEDACRLRLTGVAPWIGCAAA